jgi:hypothetical protein
MLAEAWVHAPAFVSRALHASILCTPAWITPDLLQVYKEDHVIHISPSQLYQFGLSWKVYIRTHWTRSRPSFICTFTDLPSHNSPYGSQIAVSSRYTVSKDYVQPYGYICWTLQRSGLSSKLYNREFWRGYFRLWTLKTFDNTP